MRKLTVLAALAAATVMLAPTVASAGGNSDKAPGHNKDLIAVVGPITGSPTPGGSVDNLGGVISGFFYGNTSNAGIDSDAPTRGHGVTPSISPGPHTIQGTFCSIGGLMHDRC